MEMGVEMQDRAHSLWPHLNGTGNLPSGQVEPPCSADMSSALQAPVATATAHHDLPPIAALTSYRPSSSPAPLKIISSMTASTSALPTPPKHALDPPRTPTTPSPSPSPKPPVNNSLCPSPSYTAPPSSPRDHIFALPNPPRPQQPPTRAPTPFPEAHSPIPHISNNASPGLDIRLPTDGPSCRSHNTHVSPSSPVPFSIPSKSAFAAVPRPQPIRPQTCENVKDAEGDVPSSTASFSGAVGEATKSPTPHSVQLSETPASVAPNSPTSDRMVAESLIDLGTIKTIPAEDSRVIPGDVLPKDEDEGTTDNTCSVSAPAISTSDTASEPVTPLDNNGQESRVKNPSSTDTVISIMPSEVEINVKSDAFESRLPHLNANQNYETEPHLSSTLNSSLPPNLPSESDHLSKEAIDKIDTTHQHLTSDGMKNYSNKNRRYLATPVEGAPPLLPNNMLNSSEFLFTHNERHSSPGVPPPMPSTVGPPQSQPRATPANLIMSGVTHPSSRVPTASETLLEQHDGPVPRVPSRPSVSPAHPHGQPNSPQLLPANATRVTALNVPYQQPPPCNNSQPQHVSHITSEQAQNFSSQNFSKHFQQVASTQDQYRKALPSSASGHPNTQQVTAQVPSNFSFERYNQMNPASYYRANQPNNPQLVNSRGKPMPERIGPHRPLNPSDMRNYRPVGREVAPHQPQITSSRDMHHSAHSERPLAFHVTGNRQNEPLPTSMPSQVERPSFSQPENFPSPALKGRFPQQSPDQNYDRAVLYPHLQKTDSRMSVSQIPISTAPTPQDYGSYPRNRAPESGYNDRSRVKPPLAPVLPHHDRSNYPANTALGMNDFARTFQQQQQPSDKGSFGYPVGNAPPMQKGSSSGGKINNSQQPVPVGNYQAVPSHPYPAYSATGLPKTVPNQKRQEPPVSLAQPYTRHPYPGPHGGRMPPGHPAGVPPQMQYPSPSHTRQPTPQTMQYHRPHEPQKPSWEPTTDQEMRNHETMAAFMGKPIQKPVEQVKQVYLPQDLAQLHRTQSSYPQSSQAALSPRDRGQHYPPVSSLPRVTPPSVVSVSSSMSPRVSTHPGQNTGPHYSSTRYMQQPSYQLNHPTSSSPHNLPPSRSLPSSVSSTSSPSLPRVSFPGHVFSSASHTDPQNTYMTSQVGHAPMTNNSHHQRLPGFHDASKSHPQMPPPPSPSTRGHAYPTNQNYPYQSQHQTPGQMLPQGMAGRQPGMKDAPSRPSYSPYAPSRGHAQESDTCRNPFELPTPGSAKTVQPTTSSVIKTNYSSHLDGYHQRSNEQKTATFLAGSPLHSYPTSVNSVQKQSEDAKYMGDVSRYPMANRTQQRSVSGSDDRQKPPQISARFPPVPQSNFDLQRQIYDRMTGLQQAPPRLLEKSRAEEKPAQGYKVEAPAAPIRLKRESPLDLSVKTVRQSADSTRDDVDLYGGKHYPQEPILASAPKIDFSPNFSVPLVQPEAQPLPPVQSIRKFSGTNQPVVGHIQEPTASQYPRKRPAEEREPVVPPKIPKVDAWKLAMDEQIEERLKTARQSRPPAAPLTPLHPPAQSVTPTNPELLQPPARPHHEAYGLAHRDHRINETARLGARGWSSGVFQPPAATTAAAVRPADPDRIVQQISQGVLPDSRVLHDHSVFDKVRTSLEEKQARLQALQAASRRQQPLPPFDALGAEMMCTPPSYPQPAPRGAEPVPIGVEPNSKYLRGAIPASQDPDLDGLAAFLAARIRTKAEMKQMSSADFRLPELQGGRPTIVGSSPKSVREARLSQGSQGSRRHLMSPGSEDSASGVSGRPRDPSGIRSSSETSVFDFRESDSEGEGTSVEKKGLDGLRRPRKTLPRTEVPAETVIEDLVPAPVPNENVIPPDPDWDKACDMLVEQLKTRPIKRSVRKKKPNPKFYTNELEAPTFFKVKTEINEQREEGEVTVDKASSAIILPKNSQVKKETDQLLDGGLIPPLPPLLKEESSSEDDDLPGVTVVKEGRVKLITRKQRTAVASDSEWGSSIADSDSTSGTEATSDSGSEEESEDSTARKISRKVRKVASSDSDDEKKKKRGGVRTRNRLACDSEGESDESVQGKKRTRNLVASDTDDSDTKTSGRRTRSRALGDSDDASPIKSKGRRTRNRAVSESDEDSDEKSRPKKKGAKIQTRQQARAAPPARMKLRSKKRSSAKGPRGDRDDDGVKYKKKMRVPEKLISTLKSKKGKEAVHIESEIEYERSGAKSEKKVKTDKKAVPGKEGNKSKVKRINDKKGEDGKEDSSDVSGESEQERRGHISLKGDMMQKRAMRASVGQRRSNKALQNSMRHLNKKRSKLRRKIRSGLDYMRKAKKKPASRKGGEQPAIETKRRERSDMTDISAEVKSWVVNKSAGETLLHRAARLGYADVVAYCLESLGMAASPKDNAGYTPLHEACSRGHVSVAEHLLQYGAQVSESAPGGIRPLHQAVENNHMELVRLLLAYGADPMLTTYTGQTALSLATNDSVAELIQRHVADVLGDEAPKWSFDGPASVFDPKWVVDPLSGPPSPVSSPCNIEMEASRAMLPPLYRLSPAEGELYDPSERWVLLSDVVTYVNPSSVQVLLDTQLATTVRRDMTDKVFMDRAAACNILSSIKPPGRKVTLLRYDDAVRQLLDIEVLTISLVDC